MKCSACRIPTKISSHSLDYHLMLVKNTVPLNSDESSPLKGEKSIVNIHDIIMKQHLEIVLVEERTRLPHEVTLLFNSAERTNKEEKKVQFTQPESKTVMAILAGWTLIL